MFHIGFPHINVVTFFSGIAGVGNIISWVNNLSNDKAQVDNIIWELENYKYQIQNYKTEVIQYFDEVKNFAEHPDIIKNEVISKFDEVKNDYNKLVDEIKSIKKIGKWLRLKTWSKINLKKWFKKLF